MYMLAGKAKQRLVLQIMTGENLAEKADECPLIRVVKYCLYTIGSAKTVHYTEEQSVHCSRAD